MSTFTERMVKAGARPLPEGSAYVVSITDELGPYGRTRYQLQMNVLQTTATQRLLMASVTALVEKPTIEDFLDLSRRAHAKAYPKEALADNVRTLLFGP